MMAYHDNNSDFSRKGLPKSGQGVRGGVAYRKLSDSYANDKNYPRWFFIGVNALLILLALALLALLLYAFTPLGDLFAIGEKRTEIVYTLELYDVDGALSSAPAIGTSLIDPQTGDVLGEITAMSTSILEVSAVVWQEEWEQLPQDATETTVTLPLKLVTVTVTATARYGADHCYRVAEHEIRVGDAYTVSLAGTVSAATCTNIAQKE